MVRLSFFLNLLIDFRSENCYKKESKLKTKHFILDIQKKEEDFLLL